MCLMMEEGDPSCSCDNTRLTYMDVEMSGPAARPLEFPTPTVHSACRKAMNVYDPNTGAIVHVKNVLYRAPTKHHHHRSASSTPFSSFPQRAYCIQRKISDAIYGSVRLCTVLKRRDTKTLTDLDTHSPSSSSSSSSSSSGRPFLRNPSLRNHQNHNNNNNGRNVTHQKPPFRHRNLKGGSYGTGEFMTPDLTATHTGSMDYSNYSSNHVNHTNRENIQPTHQQQHHPRHSRNSSCSAIPAQTYHSNQHQQQPGQNVDFALWESTGEQVAVKLVSWTQVRRLRGHHLEDPLKEIAARQLLGDYHPHVLGSIEVMQDDNFLYSIIPYCKGGDLYGEIMSEMQRSGNGRMEEDRARHWFRQILLGLHHLQQKGVCHRDLSLENIMVHENKCLIMDMGMCLRVPYSDPSNEGCVTDVSAGTSRRLMTAQGQGGKWIYMAPEIVAREEYFDGFAIDLWAAGVILYIMLVGLAPFKWAHESDERFTRFCSGGLVETLEYHGICLSREAGDLLQNMFWRDPRQRFTLAQVMEHPWFVGGGSSSLMTKTLSRNPRRRE